MSINTIAQRAFDAAYRYIPAADEDLRAGAWGKAEKAKESDPTYTLDRQIAQARAEMGEVRWAELQREWVGPEGGRP